MLLRPGFYSIDFSSPLRRLVHCNELAKVAEVERPSSWVRIAQVRLSVSLYCLEGSWNSKQPSLQPQFRRTWTILGGVVRTQEALVSLWKTWFCTFP